MAHLRHHPGAQSVPDCRARCQPPYRMTPMKTHPINEMLKLFVRRIPKSVWQRVALAVSVLYLAQTLRHTRLHDRPGDECECRRPERSIYLGANRNGARNRKWHRDGSGDAPKWRGQHRAGADNGSRPTRRPTARAATARNHPGAHAGRVPQSLFSSHGRIGENPDLAKMRLQPPRA